MVNTPKKHLFLQKDTIPEEHREQLPGTGFHGPRIFKCCFSVLILHHRWKLQHTFGLVKPAAEHQTPAISYPASNYSENKFKVTLSKNFKTQHLGWAGDHSKFVRRDFLFNCLNVEGIGFDLLEQYYYHY